MDLEQCRIGTYGPLSTISRAQMERSFRQLFGAHQLTMRLLPAMLPHGEGRIVITSSVMGLISTPGRGAYAARNNVTPGGVVRRAAHGAAPQRN